MTNHDEKENSCWFSVQSSAFYANRESSKAVLRGSQLNVQYAVDPEDESFDPIIDFIFPIYRDKRLKV